MMPSWPLHVIPKRYVSYLPRLCSRLPTIPSTQGMGTPVSSGVLHGGQVRASERQSSSQTSHPRRQVLGAGMYLVFNAAWTPVLRLLRALAGRKSHFTLQEELFIRAMRHMVTTLSFEAQRSGSAMALKRLESQVGRAPRAEGCPVPSVWYGTSDLACTEPGCAIVLYFHGGGYCVGNARQYAIMHRRFVKYLKERGIPARVLSVDYSLAPECPFPKAVEEGLQVYEWVLKTLRIPPSRVIFAGDSAGGGLVIKLIARLAKAARAANSEGLGSRSPLSSTLAASSSSLSAPAYLPLPAGLVLLSPWVEYKTTADSYKRNAAYDYLEANAAAQCAERYLKGCTEEQRREAVPMNADLRGFPPTLLVAGEKELFIDDNKAFAEKAKRAGVRLDEHYDPRMVHVFPVFAELPASEKATVDMCDWMAKRLKEASASPPVSGASCPSDGSVARAAL